MSTYIRLIALSILMVGLSSCISDTTSAFGDIGDGGLLSDLPCGPPCFQKIYPGITTEQSVQKTLQDFSQPCRDIDFPGTTFKVIDCQGVSISFRDSIVDDVSFYPSAIITVQEVIDKYGAPEGVSIP